MTLRDLLTEGLIRPHRTSAPEIADLLRVVDRDFRDAAITGLSTDRRFATAYNAVLPLATLVLRATGYRTSSAAHHWTTLQALSFILKPHDAEQIDYFDSCRRKRNLADYGVAGMISEAEAHELLTEAKRFRKDVIDWLEREHPHLIRSDS